MFKDYDKVLHSRYMKLMISCWIIMVAFWGCAWYADWVAAAFSMAANMYFVFGVFWWFRLWPEKGSYES